MVSKIRIVEQKPLPDKDSYYSLCSYDESDKRIRVVVTAQAIKDIQRFDCSLNKVTELSVENALERGQREGEVAISTESPTFQHLIARFKTVS